MDVKETIFDSWRLDDLLETLQFQIYAYQKCKRQDHHPLMEMNLAAIRDECKAIGFILRDIDVVSGYEEK